MHIYKVIDFLNSNFSSYKFVRYGYKVFPYQKPRLNIILEIETHFDSMFILKKCEETFNFLSDYDPPLIYAYVTERKKDYRYYKLIIELNNDAYSSPEFKREFFNKLSSLIHYIDNLKKVKNSFI